jgi:hypothetical protein
VARRHGLVSDTIDSCRCLRGEFGAASISAAAGVIAAEPVTNGKPLMGHVPKKSGCCGPRSRRKPDAEWSHLIAVALL